MGVSLLNFFDLKPPNTSKRALNTNHPFFWDTLYIIIIVTSSSICFSLAMTPKPKTLDHASLAKTLLFGFALD